MIMLYSLNLHNVIYKLYLNKAQKKREQEIEGLWIQTDTKEKVI